jgi:hypothetical protein
MGEALCDHDGTSSPVLEDLYRGEMERRYMMNAAGAKTDELHNIPHPSNFEIGEDKPLAYLRHRYADAAPEHREWEWTVTLLLNLFLKIHLIYTALSVLPKAKGRYKNEELSRQVRYLYEVLDTCHSELFRGYEPSPGSKADEVIERETKFLVNLCDQIIKTNHEEASGVLSGTPNQSHSHTTLNEQVSCNPKREIDAHRPHKDIEITRNEEGSVGSLDGFCCECNMCTAHELLTSYEEKPPIGKGSYHIIRCKACQLVSFKEIRDGCEVIHFTKANGRGRCMSTGQAQCIPIVLGVGLELR